MLTIFAIPKPFTDKHINIIQRNAIQSWLLLRPKAEVILVGDDQGVGQVAREFSLKQLPNVARNEYGTPLLDSAFELVRKTARNNFLCYLNADIILLSNFLKILKYLPQKEFLVVGQRWNLGVKNPINYTNANWEKALKKQVKSSGKLNPPEGMDYFFLKKQSFKNLPSFAVGRAGWDNWMVYEARKKKMLVIDATPLVTVIHQNHGYSHQVDNGKNRGKNIEAQRNLKLAKEMRYIFTTRDADWQLTKTGLEKKRFDFEAFLRYLKYVRLNPDILPGNKIFWQPLSPLAGWLNLFLERLR